MDTTIYKLLNADAKSWWHHKVLRNTGKTKEARLRERNAIRSHLRTLKNAWFFSVGKGGWTIHYNDKKYTNCRLQGYGGINSPMIRCCIITGIPGYDVSQIRPEHYGEVIHAPLVSQIPDEPNSDGTYNGMMYAPIDYVLRFYQNKMKAIIYNLPS